MIEPRLQTAVSSEFVTSMISVQRLLEWMTFEGRRVCAERALAVSLKQIQAFPVSARVWSMRP
ncbi:hypothetical protein D3C86_1964720 [compost metagenome]